MTNQKRLERFSVFTPKGTELFIIEIIAEGLLVVLVNNTPMEKSLEFGKIGLYRQSFIYIGPFKTTI